jgi:hypothetical protein
MRHPIPLALAAIGFVVLTMTAANAQRGDAGSTDGVVFRNISREAGLAFTHVNGASPQKHFVEIMGSGGLFFDFDNDGWIDVFLVDGGSEADPNVDRTAQHRLFRNRQNGTFEDVTGRSGIRHREYGMGACAGDFDNDGLTDLYITSFGPNALYRNAGNGAFVDVTTTAGVGSPLWSTSCAFVDVDRDGRLDLFVTNYVDMGMESDRFCGNTRPVVIRAYCHPLNFRPSPNVLYRNTGGGTFTDDTRRAGVAGALGNGLGVAVGDYDDDQWPDLFVANDGLPNFLFHNDGKGRFTDRSLVAGVSVALDGKARAGMGAAFGDADGDGRLDLAVTNHETEMHSLFRNLGGGAFADATATSGVGRATLPYVGFGVVFTDHDNDGDLDLSIVNGHVIDNIAKFRTGARHAQRRLLLRNDGAARFRDISAQSGPGFAVETVGRTVVAGDIDNDGDLDLLLTNNGGDAELLRNDGGNRNRSVLLRLVGTSSNRTAIGAHVRATSGPLTQVREVTSGSSYLGQNDLRVHLGLGAADGIDRLEIRWPSGKTESLGPVPPNQILTIREGSGIIERSPLRR